MTRLSVNINKFATLRNARGGNNPNLVQIVNDVQRFGAQGITVHPRPDERHIRYSDVLELRPLIHDEFNIEGYPSREFLELVSKTKPEQVTLVPDGSDVLTSDSGWDTVRNESFLKEVIQELKSYGVRVSLFCDPLAEMVEGAAHCGTDRIELYTGPYANQYLVNREQAILPYLMAAKVSDSLHMGLNAGHDLDLVNLKYFKTRIPSLLEVSIGHALICDALHFGLESTIGKYLSELK